MFFNLANYRIRIDDIKYITWGSTRHCDNTSDITAIIRFRDGEEIKIMNISEEQKQSVEQVYLD